MKKLILLGLVSLIFLFSIAYVNAVTVTISSRVIDAETKESIPFASVYVPGTNIGTATDVNGGFSLSVNEGATVEIAMVGYETRKMTLGELIGLKTIELTPVVYGLDEVVVTACKSYLKVSDSSPLVNQLIDIQVDKNCLRNLNQGSLVISASNLIQEDGTRCESEISIDNNVVACKSLNRGIYDIILKYVKDGKETELDHLKISVEQGQLVLTARIFVPERENLNDYDFDIGKRKSFFKENDAIKIYSGTSVLFSSIGSSVVNTFGDIEEANNVKWYVVEKEDYTSLFCPSGNSVSNEKRFDKLFHSNEYTEKYVVLQVGEDCAAIKVEINPRGITAETETEAPEKTGCETNSDCGVDEECQIGYGICKPKKIENWACSESDGFAFLNNGEANVLYNHPRIASVCRASPPKKDECGCLKKGFGGYYFSTNIKDCENGYFTYVKEYGCEDDCEKGEIKECFNGECLDLGNGGFCLNYYSSIDEAEYIYEKVVVDKVLSFYKEKGYNNKDMNRIFKKYGIRPTILTILAIIDLNLETTSTDELDILKIDMKKERALYKLNSVLDLESVDIEPGSPLEYSIDLIIDIATGSGSAVKHMSKSTIEKGKFSARYSLKKLIQKLKDNDKSVVLDKILERLKNENKKNQFEYYELTSEIVLEQNSEYQYIITNKLLQICNDEESIACAVLLKIISNKRELYSSIDMNNLVFITETLIAEDSELSPSQTLEFMLYIPEFSQIYNHNLLSSKEKWERNSIALAVYRFMKENPKYNINEAIKYIIDKRKKFESKTILGPNIYFITFSHKDPNMQNQLVKNFAKQRGVINILKEDLKGPDDKNKIMNTIVDSKNKGKTAIWINVHGLPNYVCLGGGIPQQERIREGSCEGFRYDEFADILLRRENLQEVTLIIDSCFSYNFAEQLLDDLKTKGSNSYPTIITETNKGKVGYISLFIDSLHNLNLQNNEPLLGKHIYEAEQYSFELQDSAVFFSATGTEKSIEIAQNYLNHECVECQGETCPADYFTADTGEQPPTCKVPGRLGKITQAIEDFTGIDLVDDGGCVEGEVEFESEEYQIYSTDKYDALNSNEILLDATRVASIDKISINEYTIAWSFIRKTQEMFGKEAGDILVMLGSISKVSQITESKGWDLNEIISQIIIIYAIENDLTKDNKILLTKYDILDFLYKAEQIYGMDTSKISSTEIINYVCLEDRCFDKDEKEKKVEKILRKFIETQWNDMIENDLQEISDIAKATGVPAEAILSTILVEDIRTFSPDIKSMFSKSFMKAMIRKISPNKILVAFGHNPNPRRGHSSYGVIHHNTFEGAKIYLSSLDNLDEGAKEILSKENGFSDIEKVALVLKAHMEYWKREGYDIFEYNFDTINTFGERVGLLETLNVIFAYHPDELINIMDDTKIESGFHSARLEYAKEGTAYRGKREIPKSSPELGGTDLWGITNYGILAKVFVDSGLATDMLSGLTQTSSIEQPPTCKVPTTTLGKIARTFGLGGYEDCPENKAELI